MLIRHTTQTKKHTVTLQKEGQLNYIKSLTTRKYLRHKWATINYIKSLTIKN